MLHHAGLLNRDLSRRTFLRSALMGAGLLSWSTVMHWQALGAAGGMTRKRSLILLWQDGGPSHFETFDPKPDAPSEYRGELGGIQTSLPGVAYCEVLPRLARLADRTAIIRSLHQPSSDHVVGSHNVLTGWYDETEGGKSRYPDLASVISHMGSGVEDAGILIGASTDPRLARGMRKVRIANDPEPSSALPRYIDINSGLHRGGPAFLGPLDGPFRIAGDPSKPGFAIQNLDSTGELGRFRSRHGILTGLDRLGDSTCPQASGFEQFRAIDGFRRQAFELIAGGAAARAFDLSRERADVRERYGLHLAGQQCLLARRLIEAGVGVVAVRFSPDGRGDYDQTMIGWDDHAVHGNIFEIMRQRGPQFDQSISALIEDLEQRGLRDETLLVVVGEFGRTPRIHIHKGCPGREHWGPAGCALVYGGGLTMGQVVGSTNDQGESPQDRPVTYQDLLATIYQSLGIDRAQTFVNQAGRPVPILPAGAPIAELTTAHSQVPRSNPAVRAVVARTVNHNDIDPLADDFSPAIALAAGASNAEVATILDLPHLQSLIVHDARIDDDGLAVLAGCRSLRRLQLNGNAISDAGLSHLAGLNRLEELVLTGTRTTDAGLAKLQSLRQLRRLAINGTAISLEGVVRLFVERQQRTLLEALTALNLTTLDERGNVVAINVAGTSFGDEELQHLGSVSSLRELHLAATRITDRGLANLGALENLERLHVAKCQISDAGLTHVARLRRLKSLNLVGTKVTSAGLASLAELSGLHSLYITDLKLSHTAVDNLKARLPLLIVTDYTPA